MLIETTSLSSCLGLVVVVFLFFFVFLWRIQRMSEERAACVTPLPAGSHQTRPILLRLLSIKNGGRTAACSQIRYK